MKLAMMIGPRLVLFIVYFILDAWFYCRSHKPAAGQGPKPKPGPESKPPVLPIRDDDTQPRAEVKEQGKPVKVMARSGKEVVK